MWWFFIFIGWLVYSGISESRVKNKKDNSPIDKSDFSSSENSKTPSTTSPKHVWDTDINSPGIDPNSFWGKLRTQVFKKDCNRCVKCGTDRNLTVHHKVALGLGGNNNLENLELLCKNCHETVHNHHIFDDTRNFRDIDNYGKNPILSKKVKVIADAIKNSNNLTFDYTDSKNRDTHRTVTPKNLFKEHSRIYVRTFCHLRNAERTFRVSRLTLCP